MNPKLISRCLELVVFMFFFCLHAISQEGIVIPISQGGEIIVDCSASQSIYFTDDNSGSTDFQTPYSNQNYSITLCPSNPGDAVQVDFLAFDLQTNANSSNSDKLYVYDGEIVGENLVGVGTGDSFSGVSITASIDNPSGCVSFQFVVNNGASDASAGWVAEVRCVTPCAYPESGLSLVSPDPFPDSPFGVGLCIDEQITFDASSSLPGSPDFPLDSLIWNWGDGTIEVTSIDDGLINSHSYGVPGEYIVTLVVQDVNQCSSTNLWPYQVLVSTIPTFNTVVTSPMCVNAPGVLDGTPVESVTWTALPPVGVSEFAPLPDATGVTFTSSLFIDFFDANQTLQDCSDFFGLTANLEHSFLGDLTMWVECPNGTEVILMENQPNGGLGPSGCIDNNLSGTFLGEPIDDGSTVPGVGYDYTWSVEGDWVLNDAENPFIENNSIQPGTYLPCGDLCDFVGCPLNGIWTFNVIDQWAIDNGTLFEWGIDFNPEIVPGITTFTPEIGSGADSSFWHEVGDLENILSTEVEGVIEVSPDGNVVEVMFDEVGQFEFGYVVLNDFGCAWDTTVTIEVIPSPADYLSAGPDLVYCNEPIQLQGSYFPFDSAGCSESTGFHQFCYGSNENTIFSYCPDVPGNGNMMTIEFVSGELEPYWDFIYVYDGSDGNGPILGSLNSEVSGQSFTATNPDGCISFQVISDGFCDCATSEFCDFAPLQWSINCQGEADIFGVNFSWESDDFLNDGSLLTPTLLDFQGEPTEFILTVEVMEVDGCSATDTMMVVPSFGYNVEVSQLSCEGDDGAIEIDIFDEDTQTGAPYTVEIYWDGPLCIGNGDFSHCYGDLDTALYSYCPDIPGDGSMMEVEFSGGTLDGYDVITVYNGANGAGDILGVIYGAASGQVYTATNDLGQNPLGCISMLFESDGYCSCATEEVCGLPAVEWTITCSNSEIESLLLDSMEWNGSTIMVDSLTTGNYSVVLSDNNGCVYRDSIEIFGIDTAGIAQGLSTPVDVFFAADNQLPSAESLPDSVWYANGDVFPIHEWLLSLDSMPFYWEGEIVDHVAVEGCDDAVLWFSRDIEDADNADSVLLQWGGSAVPGIDFAWADNWVVMEPNVYNLAIQLTIENDLLLEGVEDVLVTALRVNACGDTLLDSLRLLVLDPIPIISNPTIQDCPDSMGNLMFNFDDIDGFGPFFYQWSASQNTMSEDWLEFDEAIMSNSVGVADSLGQVIPDLSIQLVVQDQCNQEETYEIYSHRPVIEAAQFCVDSFFEFPAANANMPVLDVLVNGESLIEGDILQDTLSIDAEWLDGYWQLGQILTGPYDWNGWVTLIDTCGVASTAEMYILEYPCTEGCTDDQACNYIGDAGIEDGSCEYPGDACVLDSLTSIESFFSDSCDCVSINPVASLGERNWEEFLVVPNPSSGRFRFVGLDGPAHVRLFALDGRLVYRSDWNDVSSNNDFMVPAKDGVYLIEVIQEKSRSVARILIQNE